MEFCGILPSRRRRGTPYRRLRAGRAAFLAGVRRDPRAGGRRRRPAAARCTRARPRRRGASGLGSAGAEKLDGWYHAHAWVATQRRYTAPPGRDGAACVSPQDTHSYCQEAIVDPPYSSFVPLIWSLNAHSSNFAACRHITIRGRKISKYSITWDVSMVNSSVIVRAASSTRRNECSTA